MNHYHNSRAGCIQYKHRSCIPQRVNLSFAPISAPGRGRTSPTSKTPSCTFDSNRSQGRIFPQNASKSDVRGHWVADDTQDPHHASCSLRWSNLCTHRSDIHDRQSQCVSGIAAQRKHKTCAHLQYACICDSNTYTVYVHDHLARFLIASALRMTCHYSW